MHSTCWCSRLSHCLHLVNEPISHTAVVMFFLSLHSQNRNLKKSLIIPDNPYAICYFHTGVISRITLLFWRMLNPLLDTCSKIFSQKWRVGGATAKCFWLFISSSMHGRHTFVWVFTHWWHHWTHQRPKSEFLIGQNQALLCQCSNFLTLDAPRRPNCVAMLKSCCRTSVCTLT